MSKNTSVSGVIRMFFISYAMAVLLIVLLSLISSLIMISLDNPTGNLGIFSLCIMLFSALFSGFITAKIKEGGGLRFCALTALGVLLTMLLANVIVSSGKVTAGAFMNYGCYFGVFMLSSFFALKAPKRRKFRHR